jgi:NUDIX domain
LEETGLKIEDVEMVWLRAVNRHIEIIFRAKANGTGEVKSREINQLDWFAIDKMPPEMSAAQHEIVKKVLSKIEN